MIELFLAFLSLPVPSEIMLLLETAVRMSELLYLTEDNRNPRNILRLYNCSWLHHELCNTLFTTFHKKMSYHTFLGLYLHSLVVHAPQQMEIISLRSVNTENQERLFEQARRSASAASNRHPQNVLSTSILRLQAKTTFKQASDAATIADSIVSKAGASIPGYKGTIISKTFIDGRKKSWQAHMKRIGHYLIADRGIWWEETATGFHFFDGQDDPEFHSEGPPLRHFRSTPLHSVSQGIENVWRDILQRRIDLPTTMLQHYDDAGLPKGSNSNAPQIGDDKDASSDLTDEITNEDSENEDMNDDLEDNTTHSGSEDIDEYLVLTNDDDHQNDTHETGSVIVQTDYSFKTKHGLEVSKVLGPTDDLKLYDNLRYELKSRKSSITSKQQDDHDRLLYKLQLAVQRERMQLLETLGKMENAYFTQHGKLPTMIYQNMVF